MRSGVVRTGILRTALLVGPDTRVLVRSNRKAASRCYLPNAAATERLSLRSRHLLWPSRANTSFCMVSHIGIAATTDSLPRGVIDSSRVRRSAPGVILISPRVTNGRSNRDKDVRSITRSSAIRLTVIGPLETRVTSTGSWVDRRPDGFKASSYICVMVRDIFRRFRQTQAATIEAHLPSSGSVWSRRRNLFKAMNKSVYT